MPTCCSLRVLVADDSALLRRLLAEAIGEVEGVDVVAEAADGAAALAGVQTARPDVVVMDLQMPVVGGLLALRALRRSGGWPQVIMLTNHAGDVYRQACLDEGADHFFDKSDGTDSVVDVLRTLASSRVAVAA